MNMAIFKIFNDQEPFETDQEYKDRIKIEGEYVLVDGAE